MIAACASNKQFVAYYQFQQSIWQKSWWLWVNFKWTWASNVKVGTSIRVKLVTLLKCLGGLFSRHYYRPCLLLEFTNVIIDCKRLIGCYEFPNLFRSKFSLSIPVSAVWLILYDSLSAIVNVTVTKFWVLISENFWSRICKQCYDNANLNFELLDLVYVLKWTWVNHFWSSENRNLTKFKT